MGFQYFAGAAFRALTAHKDGPSLYDVCDPLLQKYQGGDPHLGQFYRTALANPALRPLLRRTGLPALKDEARLAELRAAHRPRPRRGDAGLGRGRRAGGSANGRHRCAAPAASRRRPCPRAWARPRSKRRSAPARRTCCALLKERISADLCRLQPARRCRHGRARNGDGADRAELARLQEFDAAVLARPHLHRALPCPRADQPALDRDRRADVGADADPPSLGLLRRVLHRGAARLHREWPCFAAGEDRGETRDRRHGRLLPHHQPRGSGLA